MFKDMELSADVMRAYQSSSSSLTSPSSRKNGTSTSTSTSSPEIDLSVSVLSAGSWPTYPPFPISLPPSLTTHLERFKSFYVSKHSGRALTWAHGLDTVSLKAVFGGKRKELLVSLAQGVVLLLFNEVEGTGRIAVEEIEEGTKLGASVLSLLLPFFPFSADETDEVDTVCRRAERKELLRTLQSLACGKVRVLVKHPKGRDVNPGDQFSFNEVRFLFLPHPARERRQGREEGTDW
jgi:cullin-4